MLGALKQLGNWLTLNAPYTFCQILKSKSTALYYFNMYVPVAAFFTKKVLNRVIWSRYSRMDQEKFVEDSL